jgi:hypothetical protein
MTSVWSSTGGNVLEVLDELLDVVDTAPPPLHAATTTAATVTSTHFRRTARTRRECTW